MSFLDGEDYACSFFVTNTDLSPEESVDFYQKRSNSENYIKDATYGMVVGQLRLHSFWSNEAIFQLMVLAYNLLLLFMIDRVKVKECRRQIKTFLEVHFSGREDRQDSKESGDEALAKISLPGDL